MCMCVSAYVCVRYDSWTLSITHPNVLSCIRRNAEICRKNVEIHKNTGKTSRFFCNFMDFKIFPANFCISSITIEDTWVSYAERSTIISHTHIRRHTHEASKTIKILSKKNFWYVILETFIYNVGTSKLVDRFWGQVESYSRKVNLER